MSGSITGGGISAYTIGINLVVTNNVGQAVGQINTAMTGLNRQLGIMGQHVRAMRDIMAGHHMMRAGERILGGLGDMVKAGADLNTEFTRTLALGGQLASHAADIRRDSLAWAQQIPSWNPAQLDKLNTELATQVGYDEAHRMVPTLAMMGTNIAFGNGGNGGGPAAMLDAYKAVESVGGAYSEKNGKREFDQDRFERYMNALHGSILASSGLFSTHDAMMAARQGGPSLRGMEPEILFPYLMEGAVQMGAQRFGTANMALGRQLAGGVMTQRTARGLEGAHLLGHNEWHPQKGGGGGVLLNAEARHRLAKAMEDPPKWVKDVLVPLMAGKSNTELMSVIFGMFGTATAQRVISDLEQNNPQFFRARENAAHVPSIPEANKLINDTSVAQNLNNVTEAWKGFQQAVVDASAADIVTGLHALTDALHYLTTKATQNPRAAELLMGVGGAIGSLLTVGGGFLVLRGTLGILGIGGALSGLATITGLAGLGGILAAIARGLAIMAGTALLDVLGVSLTGIAVGLGAIATLTGLAELGAILTVVGAGLAAVIHALQGITAESFHGSERALEDLSRQRRGGAPPSGMVPQDGFDTNTGKPMSYHGTALPPARPMTIRFDGSIPVTLEGKTLGRITGDQLTAMLDGPLRGSAAPDPSIAPIWGPQLA